MIAFTWAPIVSVAFTKIDQMCVENFPRLARVQDFVRMKKASTPAFPAEIFFAGIENESLAMPGSENFVVGI